MTSIKGARDPVDPIPKSPPPLFASNPSCVNALLEARSRHLHCAALSSFLADFATPKLRRGVGAHGIARRPLPSLSLFLSRARNSSPERTQVARSTVCRRMPSPAPTSPCRCPNWVRGLALFVLDQTRAKTPAEFASSRIAGEPLPAPPQSTLAG